MNKPEKVLFLVDGEHHPLAIKDAVIELEARLGVKAAALYFLGGTEKLEDLSQLAMPGIELVVPKEPVREFEVHLKRLQPQMVVDLSDLPVLGPATRMELATRALASGATYRGADFQFFSSPAGEGP